MDAKFASPAPAWLVFVALWAIAVFTSEVITRIMNADAKRGSLGNAVQLIMLALMNFACMLTMATFVPLTMILAGPYVLLRGHDVIKHWQKYRKPASNSS